MYSHAVDEYIIDALQNGRQLGIHTLKGAVTDKDRNNIPPAVDKLVAAGVLVQVKKDRYALKENNAHRH